MQNKEGTLFECPKSRLLHNEGLISYQVYEETDLHEASFSISGGL